MTQGGTDHSSHRLVYYGLSERKAVAALTLLAALLGATALAYNVLANARVTAVGVLISSSSSSSSPASSATSGALAPRGSRPRAVALRAFSPTAPPGRGARDFAIICVSFLAAYLLFVDGGGHDTQRAVFLATLPILLAVRYVLFVLVRDLPADLALRRRARPARDRRPRSRCRRRSRSGSSGRPARFVDFPLEIFLVDALLCMTLVAASRLVLRLLP